MPWLMRTRSLLGWKRDGEVGKHGRGSDESLALLQPGLKHESNRDPRRAPRRGRPCIQMVERFGFGWTLTR